MFGEFALRSGLREHWGIDDATVRAHHGGMNSATWFVTADGGRWVAKAVPPDARRSFAGGLRVAGHVAAAGVPTGPPRPTRSGGLVADVDRIPLALLSWVDGAELSATNPGEQQLIGRTLSRAHAALREVSVAEADRFHWLDTRAAHLAVRPWIRPAVAAAVAAYESLEPPLSSWGLLHLDPAPEAFRLDHATGICGLIDWSAAIRGPLLYDLASAVMYVGGAEHADCLIETYLAGRTIPEAEVAHGLPTMVRLRWAVQADYFAHRLAVGDLTGIAGVADNEKGLQDARMGLSA